MQQLCNRITKWKKSLFVLQFELTVIAIFDSELECNLKRDWSTPKKVKNVPKSYRKNPSEKMFQIGYNLHLCQILRVFLESLGLFRPLLTSFGLFWPNLPLILLVCDQMKDWIQLFEFPYTYVQCERHFFLQISGSERPQEVVWWHSLYKSSGRGYYCSVVRRSEILGDK